MLYLKGCQRCDGDIYIDRDYYGPFEQCLQCGYVRDLAYMAKAMPGITPATVKRHAA